MIPLSALTDAIAANFGPEVALAFALFVVIEGLQVRYLKSEIEDVDEGVQETRERVKRMESIQMETDGGDGGS